LRRSGVASVPLLHREVAGRLDEDLMLIQLGSGGLRRLGEAVDHFQAAGTRQCETPGLGNPGRASRRSVIRPVAGYS
jgi:hypothetical protein